MKRCLVAAWLIAVLLIGSAAGAAQSDTDYESTIEAQATYISELEQENAELENAISFLIGMSVGGKQESSDDLPDVSELSPNAEVGDGEIHQYEDWQLEFIDYRTSNKLTEPDSEGLYWSPDNEFHIIELRVENTGNQSQPFPRNDFWMLEQFGAEYDSGGFFSDSSELGSDVDLIPGNAYDVWLVFDIPDEAQGLVLISTDASIVLTLDN